MTTQTPTSQPATYCGHCGEPRPTDGTPLPAHARCDQALRLEPPRYCTACRRRMVVQVAPTGWTARCSRHGEVTGAHR